ncbi:MAG: response regulator transcription factor [Anaerolineales bacterium]|nr:MAG: response regulator transcription factor [Anaerolineales bacterium]
MKTIRVLVADDHPIVRDSLRTLIATEPDLELVGEAVDGEEAVRKSGELKPDVVLMDLVMPVKDGLQAISEIKHAHPDISILVLTSFSDEDKVFPAIRAGALGYLLKDSSPQQLLTAIHDVHRGEASLHPSIALQLIREINRPSDLPPVENPLSERELEVLKLVAQGLTNQEIAARLCLSEWTVRTHVRNILGKLHLANRTQAALFALREGLADLKNE